jgi:hypothetical protein
MKDSAVFGLLNIILIGMLKDWEQDGVCFQLELAFFKTGQWAQHIPCYSQDSVLINTGPFGLNLSNVLNR